MIPTDDELFGPAKPKTVPTDDEVFGPTTPPPQQMTMPGMDSLVGQLPKLFLELTGAAPRQGEESYGQTFMKGIKEGFGEPQVGLSPQHSKALADFTDSLTKDVPPEVEDAAEGFQGLVRASAFALDWASRIPNQIYHGFGDVAIRLGLPRDFVAIPEAFQGNAGELAAAHDTGLVPRNEAEYFYNDAQARQRYNPTGMASSTEQVITPPREEPPIATAQLQSQPPGATQNVTVAGPQNVHDVARSIAPDAISAYDAADRNKGLLRNWLNEIQENIVNQATAKIDDILQRYGGDEANVTRKRHLEQIDAARQEIQAAEAGTHPAMAAVRQDLMKNDEVMRDNAPAVNEAYAKAREMFPEDFTEEAAPAAVNENIPVGGEASAAVTPFEADLAQRAPTIFQEIRQKLADAGRPDEEARAGATLWDYYYRARANALGMSPRELFNESPPPIIKAGGEPPASGAKGIMGGSGPSRVLTLFNNADPSTFIHESMHDWLNNMVSDANRDNAPDQLKADVNTLLSWAGTQQLTRAAHEKIARGFERYMMEGRAPSAALAQVFAKFKGWLTGLYQTVARLRAPINDDVRAVYDRLLQAPNRTAIGDREVAMNFADRHEADVAAATPETALIDAERVRQERDLASNMMDLEVQNAIADARRNGRISNRPSTKAAGVTRGAELPPRGGPEPAESVQPTDVEEPPTERTGGTTVKVDDAGNFTDSGSTFVSADGTPRPENIASAEDVDRAISDASTQDQSAPTPKDAGDLAWALGMSPNEVGTNLGLRYNAGQIRGAIKLAQQSAARMKELMSKVAAGGDPLELAQAIVQHDMIMERINNAATDWAYMGHALNQLRQGAALEGPELSSFIKEWTGRDLYQLNIMAALGKYLPNSGTLSSFVRQTKNGTAPIMVYYTNSLLSGPFTHAWYVVGNFINTLSGPVYKLAAEQFGKAESTTDRVVQGEAAASAFAIAEGFRKALPAALDAWRTGLTPYLPGERVYGGGNLMIPQGGPLSRSINIPYRGVAAIHTFYKIIAYEQEISAMAVREAYQRGLTGPQLSQQVARIRANPTIEMEQLATDNALKRMYMRQAPYGSWTQQASTLRNANPFTQIMFPFIRVGTEITRNAFIEQTPIGLASKEVRDNMLRREGGAAFDYQAGKMAVGLGILGIGTTMALQGLVTGNGPVEPGQRNVWLGSHRPNSLSIGGITIPINRLGPISLLLLTPANLMETYEYWHDNPEVEPQLSKLATEMIHMISETALEETPLRQFKELSDAVFGEGGAQFLYQFAPNWLPFSSALGQVARKIDPHVKEITNILDAFRAKVPGLSFYVQDKVDMFGNTIHPSDMLEGNAPYAGDPVQKALDDLHIGISKVEKKIDSVDLTPVQHFRYATLAGQLTYRYLRGVVQSPRYQMLGPPGKAHMVHEMVTQARDQAKQVVRTESIGTGNDIYKLGLERKLMEFKPAD